MKGTRRSVVDKDSSNYSKFSLINNPNDGGNLETIHLSEEPQKNIPIFRNVSHKKIRNSENLNKNFSRNNIFGFIPHFGKGILNKKKFLSKNNMISINPKENLNNNCLKDASNKTIISLNNNFNLNTSNEREDNEKNLKFVEEEIKNKIIDMSFVIQDNKSFITDYKWKNSDIFSIEEEPKKKKRRKRKIIKPENNRKIIIKKPLYDSLDEDEELQDDDLNIFYINPEGRFILILDTIVLLLSFFSFIYIPIQIAYSKSFCIEEENFLKIFILCIDVIYIFDFFVSFFRAFYNYEYKLIKDIKLILKNFLLGSFFIEFLEAFPFNFLILYLCLNKEKYRPDGSFCFYNGINGIYITIKIFSAFKIFKIFKVTDKKKNKACNWLYEIDNHLFERILRLFNIIFLTLSSMNIFICLHIFIGNQTYPNWITANRLKDKSFIEIYITALYGIIEALTTVGYGDIICDSFAEIVYQIIILSIGIVAYSWLITIIGNYVKNEIKAEIKHSKDLTMLEEIRIEFPKMSFKLYNKIHQHLQSVSNQQKKIDLNILVNSLPYSIKNLVLFKIYSNCIDKFTIFKNCENTDFISRVLTNFIPLFSMRNALLIHEGEIVENIFFVKSGNLGLTADLEVDNIEESIKRYIYERFEDIIEEDDNKNEKGNNTTNTINDSIIGKINNKFGSSKNAFKTIINQKRQTMTGQSYHESKIEKEIGKCDLAGSEKEDNQEKTIIYLRIMEIKINENFGITYMVLNKPSPLSLRVLSKKADLFLLRKHDVIQIAKTYPQIWRNIEEKAFHNMIAVKNKTFKILKNYCSYKGISLAKKKTKKNQKLNPLNLLEIKELMELEKKKKEEEKILKKKRKIQKYKIISKKLKCKPKTEIIKQKEVISNIRKNFIKNHSNEKSNLQFLKTLIHNKISSKGNNLQYMNLRNIEETNILSNINDINNKSSNKKNINNNEEKIKEETNNNDSSYEIKSQISNEEQLESKENEKNDENLDKTCKLDETEKIFSNGSEKYPNTLSKFPPTFASFIKKKIMKKRSKKKNYYKLMCLKLMETLNLIIKNNYENNINQNKETESNNNNNLSENKNNNIIYNNNNYIISNSNVILPKFEDLKNISDLRLMSSFSNLDKSKIVDNNNLSINKNTSFEIKSIYNNLNIISEGKYSTNIIMQKETEKFIRFYKNNENNDKFLSSINNNENIQKKSSRENSFLYLLENISEIKSNSKNNSEINEIKSKITKNMPNKKHLKKYSSLRKNKNLKLDKKIIDNSRKDFLSASGNVNSMNYLESSENKIIKKKKTKEKYKKIFNLDNNKSGTFITKIFKNNKNKKESINKSQSREFINEFNIMNQDNILRNSRNFEELKTKTLTKLQIDNSEKKGNKQKIEEKKSSNNEEGEKYNNNCIII